MTRHEMAWLIVGVLAIGIFLGVALSCAVYIHSAQAENSGMLYYCWAMCQPDSEVVIREFPKKKSDPVGAVSAGTLLMTDGVEKNGWVHLVNLPNETGEGWIHLGYISYSETVYNGHVYPIKANGRVACRRCIGGDLRCWVHDEEEITVYLVSNDWCVTNKGFILTDFIDFNSRCDIVKMNPDEMTWDED